MGSYMLNAMEKKEVEFLLALLNQASFKGADVAFVATVKAKLEAALEYK